MSAETDRAKADQEARRGAWLGHRADCVRCSAAGKRVDRMCEPGADLWAALVGATTEVKRQRTLDKAATPLPGQEPLFDLPRGRGAV